MLTKVVAVLIGATSLTANAWLFSGLGSTLIQQVFMGCIGALLQVALYLFAMHTSQGNGSKAVRNCMRALFPVLFLISVSATVAFLEMDAQQGARSSAEYVALEERKDSLMSLIATREAVAQVDLENGYRQRALEALALNETTMEEVERLSMERSNVAPDDKLGSLVTLLAANLPWGPDQVRLYVFLTLALALDVSGVLTVALAFPARSQRVPTPVTVPIPDQVEVKQDIPRKIPKPKERIDEIERIAARYLPCSEPPPVRLIMRENSIGYRKAKAVTEHISMGRAA